MEISNKTLTWLVVAAIAVSLFATGTVLTQLNKIKGVTGLAAGETSNATGNVTISVSTQTTLRYYTSTLDLGSLTVNAAAGFCNLTHNGTGNLVPQFSNCDNPTAGSLPVLMLENAGSNYLSVAINFSKNAATLIGGANLSYPAPYFYYTVFENESNACFGGINASILSQWVNVTLASVYTQICPNLSYSDSKDSLGIGIRLGIPLDAPSGQKNVTIYAQGTSLN